MLVVEIREKRWQRLMLHPLLLLHRSIGNCPRYGTALYDLLSH
jgi:hypothetical protein